MHQQSQPSNDGQLVARAKRDGDAFAELYRRHYDEIGRFRGSDRDFRSWLYRVATNAANTHASKAARSGTRLSEPGSVEGAVDDQSRADDERADMLAGAIRILKPKYQAVIAMRFFEDRSVAEISELLGHSQATVRSQLSRALAKLRSRLDPPE